MNMDQNDSLILSEYPFVFNLPIFAHACKKRLQRGEAKIKAGGGWEIEDDNFLVSVFHPQREIHCCWREGN